MKYVQRVKELLSEGISRQKIRDTIVSEYGTNPDTTSRRIRRIASEMNMSAINDECDRVGIDPLSVKHYWYKGKHFSINASSPSVSYEDIRDELIEEMKSHAPSYHEVRRSFNANGHLLVIDPADIHIGKLGINEETGDEYNVNIAVKRVMDGVAGIISKCSGFQIDQILFIAGNDILHTDNPKRTTTSGTPQDTDGMWYQNFKVAKKLYVDIMEMLMSVADVHFTFNPSNHDYASGFFLADVISSWFHNCQNITFDTSISHRKYYKYYNNLIGTTHGDGAKNADLPLLMAHESPAEWATTNHRYVYTHHVHHKTSKDYIGVTVESARSASGTDSWHHRNGYTGVKKAIEAFVHDKEEGQIARISHNF